VGHFYSKKWVKFQSKFSIFAVDGLNGFSNAIQAVYPHSEVQRCIVHQIRNSLKFVSWKDRKELADDLKFIYKAVNEKSALNALKEFEDKWAKTYPHIITIHYTLYPFHFHFIFII